MSNVKNSADNFNKGSETTLKLFRKNNIKANPDKYQVLENSKNGTCPLRVGNIVITNNKCINNKVLI